MNYGTKDVDHTCRRHGSMAATGFVRRVDANRHYIHSILPQTQERSDRNTRCAFTY